MGDPFFSNVQVLYHFDGSSGSTTITDSSSYGRNTTGDANCNLSNAVVQAGFGGTSLKSGTGSPSSISTPSLPTNASGNFTWECWFNLSTISGGQALFRDRGSAWGVYVNTSGKLMAGYNNSGPCLSTTSPTLNTWKHIALVGNGSTIYLYYDGNQIASYLAGAALTVGGNILDIFTGNGFTTNNVGQYIDDLRITNGTSRYTGSTYTVPNQPFPNVGTSAYTLIGSTYLYITPSSPKHKNVKSQLTGQTSVVITPASALHFKNRKKTGAVTAAIIPNAILHKNLAHRITSSVTLAIQPYSKFHKGLYKGITGTVKATIAVASALWMHKTPPVGRFIAANATIIGVAASNDGVKGRGFTWSASIREAAIVKGSLFKTALTSLTVAQNQFKVLGQMFGSALHSIIIPATNANTKGRGFKATANIDGAAVAKGSGFSAKLNFAYSTSTTVKVTGQMFGSSLTSYTIAPVNITVKGRGFQASIYYAKVTGSIFSANPYIQFQDLTSYAEAFVMNIQTKAVSRYQNYPFFHIAKIGNSQYGFKSDGIYLLQGDYDLMLPVNGTIITADSDFDSYHSKNIPFIYVDDFDTCYVTPIVDEVAKSKSKSAFNGRKVQLGRGPRGRYWAFKIENIKHLQGIEYLPEELQRRVK